MKAWLVVNHYLTGDKYRELYDLILSAAAKHNIDMVIKTNRDILTDFAIGENHSVDADFVLFWDKDVVLCRLIESMGVRTFNSSAAIAACDNKGMTHAVLSGCGIPMPETIVAPLSFFKTDMREFVKKAAEKLGLPMVIKESFGSFGAQVYLASDIDDAIDIANTISPSQMIFQKYIASSKGRDIRINVVGGEAVAAMERISESDFRANVTLGGHMALYTPSEAEKKIALTAAEKMGLDFGGVDILFGEDGPLFCEVNSNAHVKNILDCTGINVADKIFEYIGNELK